MEHTIQGKIMKVEIELQQKVQDVLYATKERWNAIFDTLKKGEEIEIHDAELELLSVPFQNGSKETVAIWNEQNKDFLIVKEKDETLSVYRFSHYYDGKGMDQSLLKDVLQKNTIENYEPLLFINKYEANGKNTMIDHFSDLEYFYMLFECIVTVMDNGDPYSNGMTMYDIGEFAQKQLATVFKEAKDEFASFYEEVKKKETSFSYDDNPYGVKKIRLGGHGNTVVFERESSYFSLVVKDLEDDEISTVQRMEILYHSDAEERMHRPLYELYYRYSKPFEFKELKREGSVIETYGSSENIHFFSRIREFLQLFGHFSEQTK